METPVVQFRYLQREHGSVRHALVPADSGLHDAQLNLRVLRQPPRLGTVDQLQRPVQPTKRPLGVGHDGQVVISPGHSAGRAQFRE
jgi:hypothetical protein